MSWRHWVNNKGYYEFKTFKVYWAYKEMVAEELHEYDFNESFTGQFLKGGFKGNRDFNPTENWFGVSVYNPDLILTRGTKEVWLSLQGLLVPGGQEIYDMYKTLFDNMAIKYILFKDGNKKIYEDFTGNLPNKELVNKFVNEQ